MRQDVYAKLSVTLIIVVAIIRFTFALSYTISGDACWHLSTSRFIATQNKIPLFEGLGRLEPFWAPPAFHFFAAFLYKISNLISSEIADASMKLVSPIFGTLTVVIVYLITRKLFDARTAFYSMLFLNFVPLFLDYSVLSYVDSTAAFFSILSAYLMINNRYFLSSASFGVALLSKYNAIFMLPMLLYLVYAQSSDKRKRFTKMLTVVFLPLLVSSIWFIRNLVLLGNPFWPFLNGIFHGIRVGTYFGTFNFSNIFSFSPYLSSYLELFGVPNGNASLIFFYDIPLIKYLLAIWIAGTLIFLYPLARGFSRKSKDKNKLFLMSIYILFLSFLLMLFIYLVNVGWFGARLLLPTMPFIGILWARGMDSIKLNNVYTIIVLVIGLGFIVAEVSKIAIAAKEWDVYGKDFEWAISNSEKKDVFYGNGQCLSYNINRVVIDHTAPFETEGINYVWANNKWRIDFPMNEESFKKVNHSDKLIQVYNNSNTGTTIYKVRQE